MAGERIGKTYEAITYIAISNMFRKARKEKGKIYWNETPEGLSVEPDFIVGNDVNQPQVIIMVTHFCSRKNSDMKCWRNIGELCEAKSAIEPYPYAINIIFDAVMKEDLKSLQEAAFDAQLIVGDTVYGKYICEWVAENEGKLPTDKREKVKEILNVKDDKLNNAISELEKDLLKCFELKDSETSSLWSLELKRVKRNVPKEKTTYLRRGFTKRILCGDSVKGKTVNSKDGEWLLELNLAKKGIAGYQICDNELSWFIDTKYEKNYKGIARVCASAGFMQQVQKVRSLLLLREYERFVLSNYESLCTEKGMLECLKRQYSNPAADINIPSNILAPANVWIYDYVAALAKAEAGRAQAFGYASFSLHPSARKTYIGSMSVGEWCSSFITQYFTRRMGTQTPEAALELTGKVLSDELKKYSKNDIEKLSLCIKEQYIAKEYEATLLTHRGFEPLLGLLISEGIVKDLSQKVGIRTCFAEKAALRGLAGKTTVLHVKNTIINWQTATEAGRDHKRKELCGRAVGLRYTWNADKGVFERRAGVEKLILLLDGTWRQKDLEALTKAGWDEIYYPDELDKLKANIV